MSQVGRAQVGPKYKSHLTSGTCAHQPTLASPQLLVGRDVGVSGLFFLARVSPGKTGF